MAVILKRRKNYTVIYVDDHQHKVYETLPDYKSALKRKQEVETGSVKMESNGETFIYDFTQIYINEIVLKNLSIRTYEKYNSVLNNYLKQLLGDAKIKDIGDRSYCETLVYNLINSKEVGKLNQKREQCISNDLVKTGIRFLKMICDYLINEGVIENNYFQEINFISHDTNKVNSKDWTLDFFDYFSKNIQDVRLYLYIHVLMSTGLELEEINALSWEDVFIDNVNIVNDNCYIVSNKILKRMNNNLFNKIDRNKIVKRYSPVLRRTTNTALTLLYKDNVAKIVPLHKQVAMLLRDWKLKQQYFENPQNLIFTLEGGKAIENRVISKMFHKTCDSIKVQGYTLTKLRSFSHELLDDKTNADLYYSNHELELPIIGKNNSILNKVEVSSFNEKMRSLSFADKRQKNDINKLFDILKDNDRLKMELKIELIKELAR